MTRILLTTIAIAAVLFSFPLSAAERSTRVPPSWKSWSADCSNTGLCYASTFVRNQGIWIDVRVIRDWPATAGPMLRITTNTPLATDGTISLIVDGETFDELPVAELHDMQATVTAPAGFRPIGGEGFWYPTGQATRTLIEKISKAGKLVLQVPLEAEEAAVDIELAGLLEALAWIDERQERTGTVSAIAETGQDPDHDAPHALAVLSPEVLPQAVHDLWASSRSCGDIDPAIFASLDAVSMPLDDKSALFILPCGVPSAYNTPYIVILAKADGMAEQQHLARMSEKGPVTTDLVYNAKWNPAGLELDGLFKGSGVGECGTWNRWTWIGSGFALNEEATRQTCDGKETSITEWPTVWPLPTSND